MIDDSVRYEKQFEGQIFNISREGLTEQPLRIHFLFDSKHRLLFCRNAKVSAFSCEMKCCIYKALTIVDKISFKRLSLESYIVPFTIVKAFLSHCSSTIHPRWGPQHYHYLIVIILIIVIIIIIIVHLSPHDHPGGNHNMAAALPRSLRSPADAKERNWTTFTHEGFFSSF